MIYIPHVVVVVVHSPPPSPISSPFIDVDKELYYIAAFEMEAPEVSKYIMSY